MRRKVKLSERAVADMKKALRRHGYNVDTKPLKVVVGMFKAFPFGKARQGKVLAEALNKSFNKQFNQ